MALQTFTVAEPVWLKYLQFHFISHHGSEPICALNDVLVFGKSAAEDLEDQLSDEALLTADERLQQPDTAVDSHTAADKQHAPVDLGKLDKARAGTSESEVGADAAVKHGSAAGEASLDNATNRTSVTDVLLLAKDASDADRAQAADEHTSGGSMLWDKPTLHVGHAVYRCRTGQQCWHQ